MIVFRMRSDEARAALDGFIEMLCYYEDDLAERNLIAQTLAKVTSALLCAEESDITTAPYVILTMPKAEIDCLFHCEDYCEAEFRIDILQEPKGQHLTRYMAESGLADLSKTDFTH